MPDTLNLDIDYFDHPKVRRLIGILGPGSETHHIRLMCYIARHRPGSGGFDDWSAEEIESAADWRGEKSKMVEALIRCGLLHEKNGGHYLHDWKDRQPHLVKYEKTKRERKKAANKRWNQERRRKKERNPKDENEIDGNASDDAKRDFASPENEFCMTSAVQGSAVTTTTHTHAPESDFDDAKKGADPPADAQAVEPSVALLEMGREILGLTCDALLASWLKMWPEDWIVLALSKCQAKCLRGGEASVYAQGILRSWKKKGGPEDYGDGSGATGNNRPRVSANRRAGSPSRYAHLDRRPDEAEGAAVG